MAPFHFDSDALLRRALGAATGYASARPFRHAVFDDFLPSDVALECVDVFPGPDDIEWDLYADGGRTLKLTTDDEQKMPPALRQVVNQFNSGPMIRFLEALTGITGLVADPTLAGGGLHRIEPGGFLDVHADFNRHAHLDLDRRVNVLLYLNPGWDPAWGGELELWDATMTRCEQRVVPELNRCVVFDTTATSYHGHPNRVACPPGEGRRSLAFYYYTNGRPAAERSSPHTTLYQEPGQAPVLPPGAPTARARIRTVAGRGARVARRVLAPPAPEPTPPGPPRNHWERVLRAYGTDGAGDIRPCYRWSVLHAAGVAAHLGYERITAVEFGVAGGNGLVALERAATLAHRSFGVAVDVVGFDHGRGLPPAADYRDAPYAMASGDFPMDEERLRARLRGATLHLGLVRDTLASFLESRPAPVGFVAFDLDYRSSTVDALRLFDADPSVLLPRVLCYFDDVLGYPWGESNGPRAAIREFNDRHPTRVVDFLPGLRYLGPPEEFHARWLECMYLAHITDHPRAADDEGVALTDRLDLD